MREKKSKKQIFKQFSIGLLIVFSAVLPYLHDLQFFEEKKGFSGFSSLRIGIWVLSIYIFSLIPWILFFIASKGKTYRFTLLVPIFMLLYQLTVYILNERESYINKFDIKFTITLVVAIFITVFYFIKKNSRRK